MHGGTPLQTATPWKKHSSSKKSLFVGLCTDRGACSSADQMFSFWTNNAIYFESRIPHFKLLIKIKQLTRTEIKNDVIPVFRACSQTYSFWNKLADGFQPGANTHLHPLTKHQKLIWRLSQFRGMQMARQPDRFSSLFGTTRTDNRRLFPTLECSNY